MTKELYDERLEDINIEEAEILDYQQKRFGPNGDLMLQKKQLLQRFKTWQKAETTTLFLINLQML